LEGETYIIGSVNPELLEESVGGGFLCGECREGEGEERGLHGDLCWPGSNVECEMGDGKGGTEKETKGEGRIHAGTPALSFGRYMPRFFFSSTRGFVSGELLSSESERSGRHGSSLP
jgi:hypothetical protein